MTDAQQDALVLEFAGETLPLADATFSSAINHAHGWNAAWLATNASSLTLANYRTTLAAAGTVNVCLRTTTQVCPGGTTPTLSTDATLSALALQDSNDNAIALSPAFDSATGAYTAMVYNQITALTLTAGKNDANATVTITSDDDTSTPGEAELNLSVGSNTLTVTVTAQSGATKTYTITVTRAAAPPAPSDCPADNTWCATMVVGVQTTSNAIVTTELSGYMSTISVGDLGSTMFTTSGGDSYSVARVSRTKITALGSATGEGLYLVADPALPDGTVLQVNTRTFTVGTDTDTPSQPGQEGWDILANPMSWTAGQNVTVSLTLPSTLSTDATLSDLALKNAADGTAIALTPSTFVSTTKSYTADVVNSIDEITVEPTSDHNATFAYLNASDTALVDADSVEDGFQVDLSEGENTVKVKVTAEDDTTTDTYTVVVTRLRRVTTTPAAPAEVTVPNDWSLIPTGLGTGDKFRLIFLSSTKTDATSYDIADYNTFIQDRAAAGHTDIRTYSTGFRAVGCTADSDARDNTATIGTGEVIHWLNGNQAADNYADFYNGDWDDEANDKNELGANGPDTDQNVNYPFTGCADNGTESISGATSFALGTPDGSVRVGIPNSATSGDGPLSGSASHAPIVSRPMYGLSQVFEVGAAALSTDATLSGLALKNAADDSSITLTPSTFVSTTKSYTADVANDVDEITVEPTSDHNATFAYLNASDTALVDADSVEDGFQVDLLEGENTVKVKVTAEDDTTTDTYTVVVTRLRRVTTTPAAPAEIEVPNDWSLIPAGLVAGNKFRLLFLSSTKTDGESYDIADYNTFIQGRAAAGHTDIRTYSPGFRALGCTADSDARDNTATIGTGEVIHWLNGNQAADNYADFYNGNWDDEANDKDESGANGPNTSNSSNYPLTGCDDDGTEDVDGGTSYALGESQVRVARPSSGAGNAGPLTSNSDTAKANTRPMYGLSQVFEVAAAGNTSGSGKPAITGTAQVGQTLTASKGTIADAEGTTKADAGDTGYAYTYQWVQVDGSTETAIPSETGTTYTPVAADVGKTIKVQASFKDDEDNAEGPLTSDATAAVVAAAPCDAVWCATMTVGTSSGYGLSGYSIDSPAIGALAPSREFTYNGATVKVDVVTFEEDIDALYMEFQGNLGGSDYTLQLGELSFLLGDPGSDTYFDISTSDIDWTNGDTVTVKLFEGLEGGTLSDDATLSGLYFEFVNLNPDVPMDVTDTVGLNDVLTPLFDPDITEYTATIPARMDILRIINIGAVPTASGATVVFTMNRNVINLGGGEEGTLRAGTNFLRFEVTAPDGMTTKVYVVTVKRRAGLKASFAVPESHDGSTPFTVTLKFNEDISSALSNVAAAVVVTNGTKGAVTADGSSTRRFLIPVTPDSSDPVRISVRGANHCDQNHAVCAVSGKLLKTEPGRWVGAEDDARLRALWLTRKDGLWIQRRPVFRPDTTSYSAVVANDVVEMTLQAAPYAKGVTVAVSGPAGTFTTTERYDGGATAKLDAPSGSTTWTVTVTSADGTETTSYEMTVTRGFDVTPTVPADVRLKTLTVTPVEVDVDGMETELSVLSFSPSFHLDTEAATFKVRVPSVTTAVRVSVEKNSGDPDVRLMRTETLGLDSLDEDPDLAGIQFELTMDRFDLGGARENRYKSIWVIGPNAGVEGHTAFNRRVYQLWITKAAEGVGLATAAEPLMAAFENVPLSHDGSSAFTFRMAFSEEVEITPEDMRDHAFVVSGATVTGAERVDGLKSLWELTLEPSGSGAVSILTPLERACTEAGALCTADGRSLTVAPALQVAGPVAQGQQAPAPLTAGFVSVPPEHDGSSAFWLELGFDAAVVQGSKPHIRALLGVTGGSVKRMRRKDNRLDHWRIKIQPSSHEAVAVTLSPSPACGATGAVCTGDGRTFTSALATQIQGPPGLTVADAEVEEAANATLAFAVTLSRAPSGTVTVDYATTDGTATAGSDYTATSGTVTFAAGETEKTVSVPVLDDAHDEGSETLTLTLSNASGAHIEDGSATGTINNTDHMPQAWLARFGRTVGSQVVDALGQRLDGATASHVTVGGIPLTGAPGAVPEAPSDDPFRLPDWATRAQSEESVQSLTANDLLLRSAFHLSSGGGQGAGAAYTAWGRVATSGFAAEVDDVTMDGDVTSGLVGFDAEWARILAGVMFSHSTGEGDYGPSAESGARGGRVESSLTGVYPYARVALNARVSAWALAGAASGELTLKQEGGAPMPAGITMRMGAVGFKGRVLDGTGASGVGLDVKTDALWVGTKSEDTGELAPTEGDVTRLRLTLEGKRAFGVGDGATFTPSAEVGLRHDGGDAETGTGLEVGAGLSYVAGALTVEGQVRTLVAHAESGYEEWGMSGAIRITPSASGRGLMLRIAPEWGRTGSAKERLWSARDASGLGADGVFEGGDARLALDAGYGVGLGHGRGVLTPYAGLVLGDAGSRTVRTGARWRVGADVALGLEGTRQTSGTGEAGNELMLRLAVRF